MSSNGRRPGLTFAPEGRTGETHSVEVVSRPVIGVLVAMSLRRSMDAGFQVGMGQGGKLGGVVKGVAAAECVILRQVGEAEEAFGPHRL
jgi:hypothetical protein